MANVLILGGGFGVVVAAETLAANLNHEHQVTLVSRDDRFLFYPALVRLAFGECDIADISFDLRKAMTDRGVRERVPRLANIGAHTKQLMRDKLLEHKGYIRKHGDDMPEIREWRWLPENSEAS